MLTEISWKIVYEKQLLKDLNEKLNIMQQSSAFLN